MITLRQNQIEPVRKGIEFFNEKKPKPSLIVAPTAFGKSIVISTIANSINDKIIVLQPSKELLEQNYGKLIALGGTASIYSASAGIKEIGDITYATIGSIKSLGGTFKSMGFTKMIIDEADRFPRSADGMLGKFLKSSGITHVLGLTATPLKLQTNSYNMESYSILKMLTSRSKHGSFFKEIIHVCQIQEMINLGFWTKLEYETFTFDKGKLVYNSTKAEYTDKSISEAYMKQGIEDKIVKKVEVLDRKSILIFVPSITEAHSLQSKIAGSHVVYSGMDNKERTRIVKGFKDLSIRVVINVNILGVGFDHPELDCIICGRMTASLSWWYQVVGRITRIHPNKKDGLVVDFVGNTQTFGKIEDLYFKKTEKEWKLYGEGGKLLTGVPMHEIGEHTEQSDMENDLNKRIIIENCIITFGTHSGKRVSETPKYWRDWMLKEYKFDSKNNYIKDEIIRLNSL